jgi:hypothetical protein
VHLRSFGSWIDRCFYRSLIIGLYIFSSFSFLVTVLDFFFFVCFCSRGKQLLGGARIEFGSVSDVSIYTLFDSSSVVFAIHLFNR